MNKKDMQLKLLEMFALARSNYTIQWIVGLELQQGLKGYY